MDVKYFIINFISLFTFISCDNLKTQSKVYKSIKIDNIEWMSENLNVSTFRNGDEIFEAKTNEEWINASLEGKPAWCHYNNESKNDSIYGKLYNWYAITDTRELAPEGWHISTELDWVNLSEMYNNDSTIGVKIKSTTGWKFNKNGSNALGLNVFPSGIRDFNGNFIGLESYCVFWSPTYLKKPAATGLTYLNNYIYSDSLSLSKNLGLNLVYGFSVRCIKNLDFKTIKSKVTNNEVHIGHQIWSTQNLDVSTYRNGDSIKEIKSSDEMIDNRYNEDGSFVYYDYSFSNKKYGKLYDIHAIYDKRGMAPLGWHIPTYKDWTTLFNYINRDYSVLKSTNLWEGGDKASNFTGFNALPSGCMENILDPQFSGLNLSCCFWCLDSLIQFEFNDYIYNIAKNSYASIRCIKDNNNSNKKSTPKNISLNFITELNLWYLVVQKDWYTYYKEYTERFPNGMYYDEAKNKLNYLTSNKALVQFDYPKSISADSNGLYKWKIIFKENGGKVGYSIKGSYLYFSSTGEGYCFAEPGKECSGWVDTEILNINPQSSNEYSHSFSKEYSYIKYIKYYFDGEDAGGHPIKIEFKIDLK